MISLRIALPQSNFDALEQHLYEVSDPFHSRYGDHLSKEEVEALVAPHQDSVAAVKEWLAEHGIGEDGVSRSAAGDWVTVRVPVAKAETMLETVRERGSVVLRPFIDASVNQKYHVWKHAQDGDILVRTTSYSLPETLDAHVELIQPTTMFARPLRQRSLVSLVPDHTLASNSSNGTITDPVTGVKVDASCNTTITITCLKQLYSAVGHNSSATNGNQIGMSLGHVTEDCLAHEATSATRYYRVLGTIR